MPDLTLSDERKQYQDLAADFAANELAPRAHEFDKTAEPPLAVLKKAWEIGLLNVRLPESLGGLALGTGDTCVIMEELAAGCAGMSAAIWGNELAVTPLLVAGSDEQQRRLLEPFAAEFKVAGYGFASNDQNRRVYYEKKGDQLLLTGTASVINARLGSWLLIQAHERGSDGKSTVVAVGKDRTGLRIEEALPAIGLKAADIHRVTFSGCAANGDEIIGRTGDGGSVMAAARAVSSLVLGSCAVGILRSALQHATQYSKERKTMGVPIGQHQAVGFMLADMARQAEAARFMLRKSAWLADDGHPDAIRSSLAKDYAVDAAMRGTTDAVQVFGGYGYSREYPVEKLMRDAKMLQLLEYTAIEDYAAAGRQLVASAS